MTRFLALIALLLAIGGCGQRREFHITNELKPLTPRDLFEMPMEGMLRNLTNGEALAIFLEISAMNREAHGDMDLAHLFYGLALRHRPASAVLLRLRDHAHRLLRLQCGRKDFFYPERS